MRCVEVFESHNVPVTAERDGTIKTVHASEGQSAQQGMVLIELEEEDNG